MPRRAREKSTTGIYHAMLRGINQQQIFEDDEDNEAFLDILKTCKQMSGFKLYAYCLMGNHVHLILKTCEEELDQIFKRIGTKYVYWYNCKYNRTGHLFQDRFKSEPIEDDSYFLTALRYVHQNPTKAGLVSDISTYKWSSYCEYTENPQIVDVAFALEIIDPDEFVNFHKTEFNASCLEITAPKIKVSDKKAKELILAWFGSNTVEAFQNIDKPERNIRIKMLKEAGLSIRQINRLTGVSKGVVERI